MRLDSTAPRAGARDRDVPAPARSAVPWVLPFLVFLGLLAVQPWLARIGAWEYLLRVVVLTAVLWVFSRHVISFAVRNALGSIAAGLVVFVVWIAPDLLAPGYRQ